MFYLRVLFLLLISVLLVFGCANTGQVTQTTANNAATASIEIKGSDTSLQVVSNLAEAFGGENPNAKISVTGGGSGTGLAALLNGEVQVANSSRPIKQEELDTATKNSIIVFGFVIGLDALSIIVNSENPLTQLTVEQIGSIYRGETTNWKELGGPDMEITLYGRQSTSGTYVFFQEHVVKEDYSPKMRNMEGTQAIVDAVRQDKSGIGYVGVGYIASGPEAASGLKVLPVAKDDSSEFISPLEINRIEDYAISRPLYQYFSARSLENQAVKDFLAFELSDEGQKIVEDSGFVKLTDSYKQKNEETMKKS